LSVSEIYALPKPATLLVPEEGWPKAGVVGAAGNYLVLLGKLRRFEKVISNRENHTIFGKLRRFEKITANRESWYFNTRETALI
jgi:hypothetical protein